MKKFTLSLFIIVGMTMMISSCSKNVDPNPKPDPGTVAPVFTRISSDTPWYNQPAHIDVQATGATGGFFIGSDQISVPYTTPTGLTAATTYRITAKSSDGKSTSADVVVPVRSANMTFIAHYGSYKMASNRVYPCDPSGNITGTYTDYPLDCNIYAFNTNNKGTMTIGSCNPSPGSSFPFDWNFLENESKVHLGVDNDWTITSLDATKLAWFQVKKDPFSPQWFRTEVSFVHN